MQGFIQRIKHLFCCLLPPFAIWTDMTEAFVDSDVIRQVLWWRQMIVVLSDMKARLESFILNSHPLVKKMWFLL